MFFCVGVDVVGDDAIVVHVMCNVVLEFDISHYVVLWCVVVEWYMLGSTVVWGIVVGYSEMVIVTLESDVVIGDVVEGYN